MNPTPPLVQVDAECAARHLARVFDQRSPDPRRLRQWQWRIRAWVRRYPDRVTRYPPVGKRSQFDLWQLEALAREILNPPVFPKP
jgi:hypothetical protein